MDFPDADGLTGEDRAEVNCFAAQTDSAAFVGRNCAGRIRAGARKSDTIKCSRRIGFLHAMRSLQKQESATYRVQPGDMTDKRLHVPGTSTPLLEAPRG